MGWPGGRGEGHCSRAGKNQLEMLHAKGESEGNAETRLRRKVSKSRIGTNLELSSISSHLE